MCHGHNLAKAKHAVTCLQVTAVTCTLCCCSLQVAQASKQAAAACLAAVQLASLPMVLDSVTPLPASALLNSPNAQIPRQVILPFQRPKPIPVLSVFVTSQGSLCILLLLLHGPTALVFLDTEKDMYAESEVRRTDCKAHAWHAECWFVWCTAL